MRIERIKSSRLTGLGNVDWTFPVGPVLLCCENSSHQRMLGKLLLELFYEQKTSGGLKSESSKGLLEVWMSGENTQFHIRRDFIKQGNEFVRSSTQVSDEIPEEQNVSLPENMTLGDYILGVNLQAFRQAVVVDWPEKNERVHLSLRINNLRQGGDEELSLIKVRGSLVGAQKRVSEQEESMVLVKAEYDALRREWESAHRQQEEERLLHIEIKNLQENEAVLSERIDLALIIQKRLALLAENPDYRELRQLQGELTQLEERIQVVESNLTTLTSETEINWDLIDNLREECLEWAGFQEQVERSAVRAQMRTDEITDMKVSLQTSVYDGLSKYEDQRLRWAEEERDTAQKKLDGLTSIKPELESARQIYSEEMVRLQELADMAEVTEADEDKLELREKRLKQWQCSTIGCSLDRIRKHFRGTSTEENLASRLSQYYEGYHVSNFVEFTRRLKAFRDQQNLVERIQKQIERLQQKVGTEDSLRRTVQTRTELLEKAFLAAKVADLPAWMGGWEEYQKNTQHLALKNDELQRLLEQSQMEEKKMHTCATQLREKLGAWDTAAMNRDEVLAVVFKVASQLREKEEVEKEIAAYSLRYNDLLGHRNMEHLAKDLEPLADLERESRISDNERVAELTTWQNERQAICKRRTEAEQRLQSSQKFLSLPVLEKKIETVKRQWMAYEDLNHAIDDAQVLLETSCEEWQTKFGKILNNEAKWILSKIPSSLARETLQRDLVEEQRDYFAYRMAVAQLTLGSFAEVPLLFSVGTIDDGETFWVDVLEYFRRLSLTRQVIFITTDSKLEEILTGAGWSLTKYDF